ADAGALGHYRQTLQQKGAEPFALKLKRLNRAVEQQPVEAAISEADAILMVVDERVHCDPPLGGIFGGYCDERSVDQNVGRPTGSAIVSRPGGVATGTRLCVERVSIHGHVSPPRNL